MFRTLSSFIRAVCARVWPAAFEEPTAVRTTRLACPALRHAQPRLAAETLPLARVLPPVRGRNASGSSLFGRKCSWRSDTPIGVAGA